MLALAFVVAVPLALAGYPPSARAFDLFPAGAVPGERANTTYHEAFTPGTPGAGGDADMHYTNVSVPTLTPFLVNSNSAVIVAPGGGYSLLAWDKEGTDIAKFLNGIGVSAFVLKYRVPARPWLSFGEAPLMDAQRALGMVRYHAKDFGLDANKIGFMGFSAGAHLTAHLSTNYTARAYPRMDAADDESCRPDFSLIVYPWKLVRDTDLTTLTLEITSSTPPFFIAQAEDDHVHVENAVFWMLGLKRAKAPPSELHVYPRGGHGYGRCTIGSTSWHEVCTWPHRAALYLRTLGVAPKASDPASLQETELVVV